MASAGHVDRRATATSEFPQRRGILEVVEVRTLARYVLRGGDAVIGAIGTALDLPLDGPINRAVSRNGFDALRIGPDEWLLLSNRQPADEISKRIQAAAHNRAFSLVDVGHRNVGLRLSGSAIAASLSAGCPQALELSRFPVDKCTRTIFGKTEIVLWRRPDVEFHLEIWRSFLPYFLDYLAAETIGLHVQ